ncbi:MAG: hypothetical protein IJ219_11315 [Bacteroidaceae bacterium]|nr:hypothetical protein [Bacteroidaceae bacterium]
MRLTPALEYEKLREDAASWNKIFLHKDGKFFHAYEWSAWLIKTVVCTEDFQRQRGDEKMLTAYRYVTKKGEYASIGFPLESLSKYMPLFGSVDFQTIEDYAEFTVPVESIGSATYEELAAAFEQWKQTLPEKETKAVARPRPTAQVDTQGSRMGMFQILSQILSYPLEAKTPQENMDFIATLKQQLASLL